MVPSKEEQHDFARPESLNLMLLSLAITSGSAREQRWSSILFDWNLHPVSLTSGWKNWKPGTKPGRKKKEDGSKEKKSLSLFYQLYHLTPKNMR